MEAEHTHIPEFPPEPRLRDIPVRWNTLARIPFLAMIRFYQMTFSRTLPPNTCRFYPTCSCYALTAIERFGSWRGLILAIRRIGRCHPWHAGGIDPVPDSLPRCNHHG